MPLQHHEKMKTPAKNLPATGIPSGDLLGSVVLDSGSALSRANMRHDAEEIIMLRSQVKCLLRMAEDIAENIEHSKYYGSTVSRGPSAMLSEVAQACRNTIDCVNEIAGRAKPNLGLFPNHKPGQSHNDHGFPLPNDSSEPCPSPANQSLKHHE